MAIKIQTKTTQIPIELGDLTLYFDMSDEGIEKLFKAGETFEKEIAKIEKDDVDSLKEMLKKTYDLFLGEGAFEKVYEIYPSIIVLTNYFWQIYEGLIDEIENRAGQTKMQKVEKYLQHKNNKRKK